MFAKRFKDRLLSKKQAGLYRNLPEIRKRQGKYLFIGSQKVLNFSSNDYLGLGSSKKLRKKVADNFLKYGTSSSSSRLVSGNYSIITAAEKEYARYFGYDQALFFPSGYQANLGMISTFFEPGDTIIFDKHIHASSVKGITLSGADFYGYNHNAMSHLSKRLEKYDQSRTAVVTESLFSMDGDFLDVEELKKLKQRYGFLTIVDEAHAFGALGDPSLQTGCGIARDAADIAIGTFGKALGLFGAFVLMPQGFKEYLINFSSPFIYTTTLPEAHAASAMDVLEMVRESQDKRRHLNQVGRHMKKCLKHEGFKVTGDAHILAVEIGEENMAVTVSQKLLENNIFVFPARYPTVPMGKAILRLGMTALHTQEDVEYFVDSLRKIYGKIE